MYDDEGPINPSEVTPEGGRAGRLTGVRVVRLAKLSALAVAVTLALLFVATPAGSKS